MSHFSTTEQAALAAVQLTDDERQPCEVWTRVMGYFRPVSFWNKGKQAEHVERRYFHEPKDGRSGAERQRRRGGTKQP